MWKTLLYNICNLVYCIYRDINAILFFLRSKKKLDEFDQKQLSVADVFRKLVKKHPNKACIVFDDQTWTYQDMEDYSNRIANLFYNKYNLRKGDCIALFLENKPEYVGIWLGMSKIGVISALINTNLRTDSLLHSINIAKAKVLIFDSLFETGNLFSEKLIGYAIN
jgi:solute carrier family 27 fatty acid transporter 1/4